jgi:ADP-glucose pyrophosphorylase
MANPNIVAVATINGFSLGVHLTTSDIDIIDVSAEHIVKVNYIQVANVDGTNGATCSISVVKENLTPLGIVNVDTSGTFFLAKTVNVPADDILVVIDKPIYLVETDILRVVASAASDLDLFVSYEVIVD